jgi:nucleoside diphosphate kinase
MPIERTLSIVKPDGVGRNLIGDVYRRFEQAGLRVVAARMTHLSQAEAEGFYAVHRERPFFKDLVRFMTSGPVIVQVLEGESAIARNREVMGRPIRRRRPRERFVPILRPASTRTSSMVRMLRKPRRGKSAISSARLSSVRGRASVRARNEGGTSWPANV